MENTLVETQNLKKFFKVGSGYLHAVDGISLKIAKGETLGVVGESGCGKTTLGRVILKLQEPTSGRILFDGTDITDFSGKKMQEYRERMQIIFQDPYSSINPRMSVFDLIADPFMVIKKNMSKAEVNQNVTRLMDTVGLASRLRNAYPHELDGGRRQRIGVARALALNPQFIVCDEPVSALDVSIQAQILNLLMDLQDEYRLTYLFITHYLSVVKHISKNIMVTYLGTCVEMADSKELFKNPIHPYTRALLNSIPVPKLNMQKKELQIIKGELASPIDPKPGCRFAARCPECMECCHTVTPETMEVSPGHTVACHKLAKKGA